MFPVKHSETNTTLYAAEGEDKVIDLPIRRSAIQGIEVVQSFWKPEPNELAALNEGHAIILTVAGRTHAPVMMEVSAVKE